jgi:hypothetical protein
MHDRADYDPGVAAVREDMLFAKHAYGKPTVFTTYPLGNVSTVSSLVLDKKSFSSAGVSTQGTPGSLPEGRRSQ